ncbi:MAG: cytochrome C oxidase subunit I [Chitinophagales bacterium]|nr:cytochrome C oxidase subunit I [Chitinophagales bacterium]
MNISKGNRVIILLELIIPTVLLVIGIYHGFLQTLYRAGLIREDSFFHLNYYQGLTLHGVINAIVLTTFFAVAFGNATIIFFLKKEINKTLNWISFSLMLVGTLLAAWAMLSGNASVLYTFYPPLKAHPFFYLGAALLVVGSWVAFFGWIPLYRQWYKENPDKKTPLAVYGTMANFIIWFIASIPVAVEIIFFLIPWSAGWVDNINIMLTRVLFWFFGHPLVYFWLLPAYIMYYTMLPKLAGGKLYSDYAGRLVFALFIILSIPVGLHHQFAEPAIGQNLKLIHAIFTFGVAIPSFLTAFTISASLEHAGRNNGAKGLFGWMFKLPYFKKDKFLFAYLICGLFIFIFGGFTGMVNASYSMNAVVHNTGWMPGHFHMTVGGPVLLAIWGMTIHLLHKLSGKEIKLPSWNVMVPYLWMIGLAFFSTGLMVGGLLGEPRRTNMGMTYMDPSNSDFFKPEWILTTFTTVMGGIMMTISSIMYFAVFFGTLFSKRSKEPELDFPVAEAYHDEKNIGFVKNLAPWTIVAVIIIVFAYYPPIKQAIENTGPGSPRYEPGNPIPLEPTSAIDEAEDESIVKYHDEE